MNITVFGASGARPATWWPSPPMAGTRSAPSYRTTPQDPPGCELAAEFLSDLCRLEPAARHQEEAHRGSPALGTTEMSGNGRN